MGIAKLYDYRINCDLCPEYMDIKTTFTQTHEICNSLGTYYFDFVIVKHIDKYYDEHPYVYCQDCFAQKFTPKNIDLNKLLGTYIPCYLNNLPYCWNIKRLIFNQESICFILDSATNTLYKHTLGYTGKCGVFNNLEEINNYIKIYYDKI